MNLTVHIPDDLAGQLTATGDDLSRRVLESFAIDEYKSDRISIAQLRRRLGFETSYELDAFLKAHQVSPTNTIEDLRREMRDLQSPGL